MPKLEIYKVKDKNESHYISKKKIFNLPYRLLIIGKSQRSGKSNYLVNLLLRPEFYLNDFEGTDIYIISPSIDSDLKLKTLAEQKDIPEENLFDNYDEMDVEGIYEFVEDNFNEAVRNKEKPVQSLIIFDDMSFSGALKKKKNGILAKIFSNGRHINLSCIVTAQRYSDVLPAARSNASGVILFSLNDAELELVSKDHSYITMKTFKTLFRQNTKLKHDTFIINYDNELEELYLNKNYEQIEIPEDEYRHNRKLDKQLEQHKTNE